MYYIQLEIYVIYVGNFHSSRYFISLVNGEMVLVS